MPSGSTVRTGDVLRPDDSRLCMHLGKHRFRNLDVLIERVHALFECWETRLAATPSLDLPTLYRVKLAVHEWLANLVQHATFDGRTPDLYLDVRVTSQLIRCTIEDNSQGFNLHGKLATREQMLEVLPERGMGLLMLRACTTELSYAKTDEGYCRLMFSVPVQQEPWLPIPFS